MKKTIAIVALLGVLTAGAITAFAARTSPNGDDLWEYGTTSQMVYSNYFHPTKIHMSSVEGKYYASSGWVRDAYWAKMDAHKKTFGTNRSYYNYR